MMKLISKSALMAIATGALVLSSCTDDKDYYDPNFEKNLAAKNFQAMLGEGVTIDQNHTWETVKNVNVSLPINYGTGANFSVTYYANDKIVGTAKVKDGQVLKSTVSVPSYTETLSVSLSGDNGLGTVIKLNVAGTASRAASRAAAAVEYTKPTVYSMVYPENADAKSHWGYQAWGSSYVGTGDATVGKMYPYVWPHKFYYVDGVITGNSMIISDAFVKDVDMIIPENDLSAKNRAIIVQDFDIVTNSNGPVKLHYVKGETSNSAAIGYFIYNDNPNDIQNMPCDEDGFAKLLSETKNDGQAVAGDYEDCYNGTQILVNPTTNLSDLKTCNKYVIIENMKNKGLQRGDEIQLTYYDADGNPSENFPEGTKIGFFIIPDAGADHTDGTIDIRRAVYSFSKMNVEPHCSGGSYFSSGWNEDTYETSHTAVFKLGNNIVVGFEDANNYTSADFDYNDFVFTLEGDFEPIPEVEDPTPDPVVQTYTYCFEDMDKNGGDYDFNDVVLKVTAPVDGNINVSLAAAGATYALRVKLGDAYLFSGKEVHEVFDVTQDVMVNTGAGTTCAPVTETVSVGENWNIVDNGDFYIEVEDRNGLEVHIPQFQSGFTSGTVPYAIRIASDFDYPTERQSIASKYPAFVEWAEDATSEIDWYNK